MTPSLETVLIDLVEGLETAEVEHVLVGGIAVLAWGDPRTTRDIDVIARLSADDLPRLEEALSPQGFSFDVDGARLALEQGSHFSIFHEGSFYHADVVPANDASHRWTLEGRQRVEIEGSDVWLASPEDTVANKLVFGSEQDVQDAAGILARRGERIDRDRLEDLAAKLGVREELSTLEARIEQIDG